jgi:hypothetical protein
VLYSDQGRYPEAEPLHRRSLAIDEKALGPEHSRVASTLNNLAGLYRAQGRYPGAGLFFPCRQSSRARAAISPAHPSGTGLTAVSNAITTARAVTLDVRAPTPTRE